MKTMCSQVAPAALSKRSRFSVASWAVVVTKPSDVDPSYSDERYVLPELYVRWHEVPDFYGSGARDRGGRAAEQPDERPPGEAVGRKHGVLDRGQCIHVVCAGPTDNGSHAKERLPRKKT